MGDRTYQQNLVRFMSWFDERIDYTTETVFSQERLAQITDKDVRKFLNVIAFGSPDFVDGMRPTGARCSTIEYWKKALSFYMPNKHMQWNEITQQGNPTKSATIHALIKYIRKTEVRQQGSASQARRPMTNHDYRLSMDELKKQADFIPR